MKNNKIFKIAVFLTLIFFVASTAAQAIVVNNIKTENKSETNTAGSTFTWEDDFLDESRIDITRSYNYILDKTQGIVKMKDTYEAWYNPDWPKMKIIDIYNSGDETFTDYVLDMNIDYDSDMQDDFADLRFTDEQGNDLFYWIGEIILSEEANVLVRVPEVAANSHTNIHMFYGDADAEDESNFDMIFNWEDKTNPDIMISYKNYLEGAWDADVEFGNGRFLVAWEERLGPEDMQNSMERAVYSCIHGRTYNENGQDPDPDGDADIDISPPPPDQSYHAEDPTIAFGNGKYFVAWEENPATLADRFKVDIKAAIVTPGGDVTKRFTICNAQNYQTDPCVAYDEQSQRFFVVWEDARGSTNNYDVYGRLYDKNGDAIGSDFQVAAGANCQDQPWICSNDKGDFLVVYENGAHPEDGPFSLEAQKYDSNGNQVGSNILIATGSSDTDHIFPAVNYCPSTERYFVAWNDADLSSGQYRGNIWGKILDEYGNTVYDNFIVQSGYQYIRTDVVPYLDTLFFISYDGQSDLWGKLVSSDGRVHTDEHKLSDGSSQSVDWNNLAVGNGKIFAVWEDERDQSSNYADAFGSVWHIYKTTGSPDVSYNVGDEQQMITEAVIMSKIIEPSALEEWEEFDADYTTPIGNLRFDIYDMHGNQVIMSDINPGRDISSITEDAIRLKATFSRTTPKDTPVLDKWSVTYAGSDYDPPWTDYEMTPAAPNGDNGWYTLNIEFSLFGHDDVCPPENIVTYYKINDGTQKIYNANNKPKLSTEKADNTFEFWSVDEAGNEEDPHNILTDIKIDKTKPTVTIETPQWGTVDPGDIKVSGTVYESQMGSGIKSVEIYLNGGKVPDNEVELSENKDTFEWHFQAQSQVKPKPTRGNQYDIEVKSFDFAGNMGNAYVTVKTSRTRDYSLGIHSLLFRFLHNYPHFQPLLQYLLKI
jgi:hypothetical protein